MRSILFLRPRRGIAAGMLCVAAAAAPLHAQSDTAHGSTGTTVESLGGRGVFSSAGAARAELAVNQVYIDRLRPEATVDGGDFASHLLERLGVRPVPDGMGLRVAVDTAAVTITGRIRDLPQATRDMLGPMLAFVRPDAPLEADVGLTREGPAVMRFRLRGLRVGGVPVPEMVLAPMMADIGRQVPALTRTGRDLFVAVPRNAGMMLVDGGIRLVAPPPAPAPPSPDTSGT